MKPSRHSISAFRGERAFSLTEVTLSIGIVAALLLPTVALLVGGASLETTSQDHRTGARIASRIEGALSYDRDAGSFEWLVSGTTILEIPRPAGAGTASAFAAFDRRGRWLREIDEGEFQSGLEAGGKALYAVRIDLAATGAGHSPAVGGVPLHRLSLAVERPAAAPRENRTRERFVTRLAAR